jgi:periplasmic protein TonB
MKRIITLSFLLIFSYSVKAQEKDEDKEVGCFLPIARNPEFKGGQKALKMFLNENLKYPPNNICVTGRVFIQFIVEKDGRITNPIIVRSLAKAYDDEAIRIVKLMPKWIPGRDYQDKKPMRMKFTIPIDFTLKQQNDQKIPKKHHHFRLRY